MKRPSNKKAALALGSLTATVALLSGLSVADAQTAPGGGSFPGSFLVPGTNTSIAFHGFMMLQVVDELGPHCLGDTDCFISTVPVSGRGVSNFTELAHAENGGFTMDSKPSTFGMETRTPTAYGEVKVFFQFDMNDASNENYVGETSANGAGVDQLTPGASSGDLFRLRMAYGTLGPILAGQANSVFVDLQSFAELLDGGGDAGEMNTGTNRAPQIRYTWLGANGVTVAASVEEPQIQWQYSNNSTTTNAVLSDYQWADGIWVLPAFVATANIDQPWGNFGVHGSILPQDLRNSSPASGFGTAPGQLSPNGFSPSICLGPGTGCATPNYQTVSYALGISGHLNTIGKDNFRGGANYVHGAAEYINNLIGPFQRQGLVWNQQTGQISQQDAYGVWGGYQHWWTDNLRSTVSMGYFHAPLVAAANSYAESQLATLESTDYTGHINMIWSPVPFVDIGIELQSYFHKVASDAEGRNERINGEFVFKF